MTRRLSITLERPVERRVLLTLDGSVDEVSAPDFKRVLLETLANCQERVIVDVTGVDALGSAGLGVLMHAARKAPRQSLAIICGVETTRVLRLLGVDRVVALHPSREAALAA